ncbi:MAG: hypothetical protein RL042_1745, partial [Nitrospirota bacterium]
MQVSLEIAMRVASLSSRNPLSSVRAFTVRFRADLSS